MQATDGMATDLLHHTHLEGAFVAFQKGALYTWIRFSAECAPGQLIDSLSPEERLLAFMPAASDANELLDLFGKQCRASQMCAKNES